MFDMRFIRGRTTVVYLSILLPIFLAFFTFVAWGERTRLEILFAGLATLAAVVLAVILLSERLTRPLRELTALVEQTDENSVAAHLTATHLAAERRDEVGQLARAFNSMLRRLQKQADKRQRERDRLLGVITNMSDGVLILSKTGKVRLINPAAEALLNIKQVALEDATFAQVARDHRLIEIWRRCREMQEEQIETVELDASHFLRIIITPFFTGAARGYLVVMQDLTRLRRLQTIRQDFVSNVSHELRTPLASLKAVVETLRDSALDDPTAARRFLDSIENEVERLTLMVEELLELSRIESGSVPLRLRPTQVMDFVQPAVERMEPLTSRAGIQLQIKLPPDLPLLLGDETRLQQVVTNLVHNAVKFTPEAGCIVISAADCGEEVAISVQDTGIGIANDDIPRIFERFYKVDRARAGGGTGLGLAITKHVVQAHSGRIWVDSTVGHGTTFHFTLPKM